MLGLPKTDVERLRRRFSLLKAGLFGVAVLAVTVFLYATDVIHDLRTGWLLQFDGEDVSGQVTGKWTQEKTCEIGSKRTHCFDLMVAYAFNLEGLYFSGEGSVTPILFQTLYHGAPIALRYSADDPQLSAIAVFGEHHGARALGYCLLFLLGLLFMLAVFSNLIETWYRMAYLLSVGLRRSALVTGHTSPSDASKAMLSGILWQDETGATGQSRMMAAARLPDLGAKITVYADPEAKLPTIWEGEFGKG